MAGESLNDKQHAAYTANAADIPQGAVRIVGDITTTASSPAVQPVSVTSGFPVIQPVSVTSGFPIVQPVSVTSGFPVVQPVSITSGFPVVQPVSITSGFPVIQPVSISSGFPVTQAVSVADGADITQGSTADAAVITDSNGTVSGKLRGLVRILGDTWDSSNRWIKIAISYSAATGIGFLTTGTNPIGSITTGSSQIGALTTGFSTIGAASTGYNVIGVVSTGTNRIGSLSTGVHPIGSVSIPTAFGKTTTTFIMVSQGFAGTTALLPASANNFNKLIGCCLVMDGAGTAQFTDGTTNITGAMSIAANGGFVLPTSAMPYAQTAAVNRPLNLVTTSNPAKGMIVALVEP